MISLTSYRLLHGRSSLRIVNRGPFVAAFTSRSDRDSSVLYCVR